MSVAMSVRHPRSRQRSRRVLLAALVLAGLATAPGAGADPRLEGPRPPVGMADAEQWLLRPSETAAPEATGSIRARPEAAAYVERRAVRLVYPALIEPR